MVRRRVRWVAAFAWASASGPVAGGRAHAAETTTPYALSYQAAPGCPAEAAFRKDTLAHVHDTASSAGARVAVSIEKPNDAFHGELVATDEEGHEGRRAIDGATCADVAHALAFLAGLAIELGGHLEKPEPKPEPAPAPPPPVAPPAAVVRPPPSQKPVEPDGLDWSTAALGEVRTGLTPEVRPALQVALDLEGRLPHLLAHAYRLGVAGAVGDLQGAGGTATLRYLAGRIEACPVRFGETRLVFRACLAFELGYVWAESHAATNPRDQGQVWPTGEALLRVKYAIAGGFFAEADVGAGLPMLRPRYFFQPNRLLYEVPVVTARAALGLGYRF